MGEIADMMLDGTMCSSCGEWLHGGADGDGYPKMCRGCQKESNIETHTRKQAMEKKMACPTCGKKVKQVGLADHTRDAHKGT